MANNDGAKNLGWNECEVLCDWFLHRMPMDMRHKLIAEMPLTYAKLFPGVKGGVILERVANALAKERANVASKQMEACPIHGYRHISESGNGTECVVPE